MSFPDDSTSQVLSVVCPRCRVSVKPEWRCSECYYEFENSSTPIEAPASPNSKPVSQTVEIPGEKSDKTSGERSLDTLNQCKAIGENSGDDRVVLAIENAFYEYAPINLQIGDLFLTPNSLYYVPYSEYIALGQAATVEAGILGGLAGGLKASSYGNNQRQIALKKATMQRYSQWGMSLQERLRRNNNAIRIPRSSIIDLKVDKILTVIVANRAPLEFGVPKLSKYEAELSGWFDFSLVRGRKHCVVTSNYAAPQLVLNSLISGDKTSLDTSKLELIAADEAYMAHLWQLFTYLRTEERRGAIKSLDQISGKFRDKFISLRKMSYASGKKELAIGLCALVLGGFLLIHVAEPWLEGRSNEPSTFLDLIFFCACVIAFGVGGAGLWAWFKSTRY